MVLALALGWAIVIPAVAKYPCFLPETFRLAFENPTGKPQVFPLFGNRSLGVAFTCPKNDLSAIDIKMVNFNRVNPVKVKMLLCGLPPDSSGLGDPADRIVVRRAEMDATDLEDWSTARFVFPRLTRSAGKRFYLVFTSPQAGVTNCVGLVTVPGTNGVVSQANGKVWDRQPDFQALIAYEKPNFVELYWPWIAFLPTITCLLWLRRTKN